MDRRQSEPEEDDDPAFSMNDGEHESGIESGRRQKRRNRY